MNEAKIIQVTLPFAEWAAMKYLARTNKVKIGAYCRAIMIDAIADEGLDVRRFRSQACPPSGEGSENNRETAA